MLAILAALLLSPPAPTDQPAWTDLLIPEAFQKVDSRWVRTDSVRLADANPRKLSATPAPDGAVWVNGPGRADNLVTTAEFADCELHVEFLIAKGSNAGVKFHGLYEIQILDSHGKTKLTGNDLGGIYPRALDRPYRYLDDGVPPNVNAALPPGEWQTLNVTWTAPRFDDAGQKTAPARVIKATLNGKIIHENVTVNTPTGTNHVKPDTPRGPILLQGDHGPVAFRNVRIRAK